MNGKFKIIILAITAIAIPGAIKTTLDYMDVQSIRELTTAINEQKICNTENVVECAHQQFLTKFHYSKDPLLGQTFFHEVVKFQLQKNPEKARFLKDQYYIFTASLYIRSLKKKNKSLISFLSFMNNRNVDVHVAKAFLEGMSDYSNRREVDRTIASETILQEVSNFNASMEELTKTIELF